jgi:hypothetical protein
LVRIGGWLAAVVGVATASPAVAQGDPLAEARAAFDAADFTSAHARLDRLAESSSLTPESLPDFLLLRALVHYAREDTAAMTQSLAQLASITRDEDPLDHRVPPTVRATFADARRTARPIALKVADTAIPGGARLEARVDGDSGALVRSIELGARAGESPYRVARGPAPVLSITTEGPIEYYAVAYGPGSAPVATIGSVTAPRRFSATPPAAAPDLATSSSPLVDDADDDLMITAIATGGAAVVVAAIVVAVVLATTHDPDTALHLPPASAP